MKIANIIFEKNLVNHVELEYINYYNVPIEYNILDKSLPTLYVGWQFMKTCNPNNPIISNCNILKREIVKDHLYWECAFDEGKGEHINGVENFIKSIPYFYYMSKYEYVNINPVFFQFKTIDEFIDILPEKIEKIYLYKDEMIYFLNNKVIYGIDLNIFNFFKFDIQTIKSVLNNRTDIFINDIEAELYQSYYRIFPDFQYLKRFLVVIH